ncbi:MAG: hypothetical protein K2P70_04725 [Hyphomonadaceae bacterium]|nr:hypothetical protein [Hyphomonadaceae bacterium]
MLRNFLVGVGAVFSAGLFIALAETALHALITGELVFVGVALSYAVAATLAAAIARRWSNALVAIVACVLLGALAALNLFMLPHPQWFAPLAIATLVGGYVLGSRIGRASRA